MSAGVNRSATALTGGQGPSAEERILAVDVGGTHMRTAVLAGSSIVERRDMATPRHDPRPTTLAAMLHDAAAQHAVHHAVVGLPGRIDYHRGTLEYAPNLPPQWVAELSADALSRDLGKQVLLANDADLAAVGEAHLGAGRPYADVAYLTVSTGIGAGVVLGGRLVAGGRSLAEIGHVVIDRVAARTGQPATVELLGSGTALGRDAATAGVTAHDEALLRLIETGDERLAAAWRDVREAVGLAAATLGQLFCPQVIVLGGGLGRASTDLADAMLSTLAAHGPRGLPEPISVLPGQLGDDAGLLGAADWWHAAPATAPR